MITPQEIWIIYTSIIIPSECKKPCILLLVTHPQQKVIISLFRSISETTMYINLVLW